jgi:hypothetical protein
MAGTIAKSYLPPEKLSDAIANFNAELCTETFLRELHGVLPNDDDVSQGARLADGIPVLITCSGASF